MQESEVICINDDCSFFYEIYYSFPYQSRRCFNLPGYFEFLDEFEHSTYSEKQNYQIDNIKEYLPKNEEGEEAQDEEGKEQNEYHFADNNDNSENIIEEKNLEFNLSEQEKEIFIEQEINESLENKREISENIFKDISDYDIEKRAQILNKRIKSKKIGIKKNKNKYIIQKKCRSSKNVKNNEIFKTKKVPLKKDEFYIKLKRIDNLRKTCFYTPMLFLKKYLKMEYGINFGSINCKVILGESIRYMKNSLELKVYQLLCLGCKYKEALDSLKKIEMDENEKFDENKKFILFFLLTRTYEELYNRYIDERFNFSFYYKDKKDEKHITITNFITLQKAIDEEIKRLKKNKKEETYIKGRIRNYSYLSIHMIKDIKAEKYVKQAKKEKSMKNPKKIEQLENWVKIFSKEKVVQDMNQNY